MKLLNELGDSGWELVTERLVIDGLSSVGTFVVEYSGTLKRPGAPL